MIESFFDTEYGRSPMPVKYWEFPAGESGVELMIDKVGHGLLKIIHLLSYKDDRDLFRLALLVDICKRRFPQLKQNLQIRYLPYARQDRATTYSTGNSLKVVANFLNSLDLDKIIVWDAHSDVAAALFPSDIFINVSQCDLLVNDIMKYEGKIALVSPDAGAAKKIYDLARLVEYPVIEAKKIRNPSTGKIEKTSIDLTDYKEYNTLIVVDDICDGGLTFVELAKEIRKTFTGTLGLTVTHGIFSKGLDELNKYYDVIKCANDLREYK